MEGDMIGGYRDKSRYLLAGASVIAVLAFGLPGAKADSVQALETQLKAMQAQIEALRREVQQAKSTASAAASAKKDDDLDLKVKWRGAPEFSSADGKFKMKLRGRLHADYNAIDQDESITGRPDVNAAEIRRARLGIEGVVWSDVKYIVEVDFAQDAVSLKDAYFEYTGLAKDLGLRAGNFKTFNSLDQLNSSNYRTFLETPALVEAYTIDRQIGAGAIYARDHFTLSAGIFGPYSNTEEDWLKDVRTGSARVTVAPINREVNGVNQVVHFGASWRGREQAEHLRSDPLDPFEDQLFQYRARGADLPLADRFVSTPAIFAQDTFWGLEGLVIWKSLHVVGEYTQLEAEISPLFVGGDPTYDGWYVEAGWWLTGETQEYSKGVYGRPKVKNPVFQGGWGGWQLVGRYDVLDLTDKAQTITGILDADDELFGFCNGCGEQNTWLIAVNWWLNNHARIQFQYGESDIEGGSLVHTSGEADGRLANRDDGANIKGFGTRVQVDW
jgi:phosphate-selective porin OprO/OprP